jgi:hypothetical protein
LDAVGRAHQQDTSELLYLEHGRSILAPFPTHRRSLHLATTTTTSNALAPSPTSYSSELRNEK